MIFYDFLFYASYNQGIKSRNYDDIPILGGITPVSFCLGLNFVTLLIIINRVFNIHFGFSKVGKVVFAVIWAASLYFYYSYKGRYKRIIDKYDKKKDFSQFYNMPYVLIIFLYMILAIILLLLVMYIFSVER